LPPLEWVDSAYNFHNLAAEHPRVPRQFSRRRGASSNHSRDFRRAHGADLTALQDEFVQPRRAAYLRMAWFCITAFADHSSKRGHTAPHETFRRPACPAKNVTRFCLRSSPFYGHFGASPNHGRSRFFSARRYQLPRDDATRYLSYVAPLLLVNYRGDSMPTC